MWFGLSSALQDWPTCITSARGLVYTLTKLGLCTCTYVALRLNWFALDFVTTDFSLLGSSFFAYIWTPNRSLRAGAPHTDLGISFSAFGGCPFGFTFWSSSLTLRSITPTWRRRLRRARGRARLAWYLHRRGFARLSTQKLKGVFSTLKSHHSKDQHFLAKIKTEMERKLDPWRCRYCMRMVKGVASQCGGCHRHWGQCQDTSYIHQPHRRAQQSGYADGWEDAPWQRNDYGWQDGRSKSPRQRTQSPRQRQQRPKSRPKYQYDQYDYLPEEEQYKGKGIWPKERKPLHLCHLLRSGFLHRRCHPR